MQIFRLTTRQILVKKGQLRMFLYSACLFFLCIPILVFFILIFQPSAFFHPDTPNLVYVLVFLFSNQHDT